jgi:hypothetical protein
MKRFPKTGQVLNWLGMRVQVLSVIGTGELVSAHVKLGSGFTWESDWSLSDWNEVAPYCSAWRK